MLSSISGPSLLQREQLLTRTNGWFYRALYATLVRRQSAAGSRRARDADAATVSWARDVSRSVEARESYRYLRVVRWLSDKHDAWTALLEAGGALRVPDASRSRHVGAHLAN